VVSSILTRFDTQDEAIIRKLKSQRESQSVAEAGGEDQAAAATPQRLTQGSFAATPLLSDAETAVRRVRQLEENLRKTQDEVSSGAMTLQADKRAKMVVIAQLEELSSQRSLYVPRKLMEKANERARQAEALAQERKETMRKVSVVSLVTLCAV
jgi:hypothetical protein